MRLNILLLVFILINCNFLDAQPGSLDQTFNDSGKVINYDFGVAHATAVQQDGKILVAGGYTGEQCSFNIARYLPDGTLDKSFGINGTVQTVFTGCAEIYNLSILKDGKILAAGYGLDFFEFPFYQSPLLAQYLPDGSIDNSFGKNGKVSIDMTEEKGVYAKAMQVMEDGRIVQAGSNGNQGTTIIRYMPDGSLDASFGNKGISSIPLYGLDKINALLIQPDNKIIVAGEGGIGSGGNFLIGRFQEDGKLDSSFGYSGKRLIDYNGNEDIIYALALQPDEKIVAAGRADMNGISTQVMAVLRFNSDGFFDSSFGKNGLAFGYFSNMYSVANSLVLQEDGKINVGGSAVTLPNADTGRLLFALAQFNSDGNSNMAFGIDGIVTTDFGYFQYINSISLQTDGKIIAAGLAHPGTDSEPYNNLAIARYNNNEGTLPVTLQHFIAKPNSNNGINLSWQTANEINNNYFSIERSIDSRFRGNDANGSSGNDGINYEIARVYSNSQQSYAYTDNTPLQGTNYYRLKQADKDGRFIYSNVVSVTLQNSLTVMLYPNPVKDVLHIKGLGAMNSYQLIINNTKGDIIAKASIHNLAFYNWNVQSLSKGVYYLSLTSNHNKTITTKFVKD